MCSLWVLNQNAALVWPLSWSCGFSVSLSKAFNNGGTVVNLTFGDFIILVVGESSMSLFYKVVNVLLMPHRDFAMQCYLCFATKQRERHGSSNVYLAASILSDAAVAKAANCLVKGLFWVTRLCNTLNWTQVMSKDNDALPRFPFTS